MLKRQDTHRSSDRSELLLSDNADLKSTHQIKVSKQMEEILNKIKKRLDWDK